MPTLRVIHIVVGRGDVEVAQQHELGVLGELVAHIFGERGEPLAFVGEFGAVERFAVYAVNIDYADAVDGGGNHALLWVVGQRGQACLHVVQLVAADNGNAVVGFLPCPCGVPAHHAKGGGGVFILFQFQLLQHQYVGLVAGEPVAHLRQAHVERIDVPCGDFHAMFRGYDVLTTFRQPENEKTVFRLPVALFTDGYAPAARAAFWSGLIRISTRRFWVRPASVLLSATGWREPCPDTLMRLAATPCWFR